MGIFTHLSGMSAKKAINKSESHLFNYCSTLKQILKLQVTPLLLLEYWVISYSIIQLAFYPDGNIDI